eukprot:Awhi_evm1s14719
MDVVRTYIKVTLPRYLKSLPIPQNWNGLKKLDQDEWLRLAPLLGICCALLFIFITTLFSDPGKSWRKK